MLLGSHLLRRHTLVAMLLVTVAACSSDEDEGTTTPAPKCGDGKLDEGETCDTTPPAGSTCSSLTSGQRPNGTPRCSSTSCTFDLTGCTGNAAGTGGGGAVGGSGGMGGTGGLGGTGAIGGAPGGAAGALTAGAAGRQHGGGNRDGGRP